MHRLHSAYFAQMIIHFPEMFLYIGSNFLPVQSKEDHFLIKTLYGQSTPQLSFLIFVFTVESVSKKIKVLPCNMVDIFCTFCNCNVYNFTSSFFFTKRSFVTFVYLIFCFVVFNSSGNKFHSFTNTCIPNVIDPCNLLLYQVVLSFFSDIIVLCFIKF